MDSSFRQRFGQLGPIQAIDRVTSGSPAAFALRLRPDQAPQTISGMLALARRGLPMLRAKRTIEALVEQGHVFVDLPTVEHPATLIGELAEAGIASAIVAP